MAIAAPLGIPWFTMISLLLNRCGMRSEMTEACDRSAEKRYNRVIWLSIRKKFLDNKQGMIRKADH
jgi:hypothetical protein